MGKRVLVALSGGVDSSVCIHLLREQGYETGGVVLKMTEFHQSTVEDAQRAAEQLGIPLYVKNQYDAFEDKVIRYFISEYCRGRTPNPCIVCNPLVKFHALLETAEEEGYDLVATGHYAGLRDRDGLRLLCKGEDPQRDQSYMLYRLTQKELSRLMFPLSGMEKTTVRQIAASIGLSCAEKPDSQENCFIPDNDYGKYIEERCGKMPQGDFISPEGEVCGRHQGLLHYTVGQRKGLGVALGRPVFIREIDPVSNRIYLADKGGEYVSEMFVSGLSETYPGALSEKGLTVKVRSRAFPSACRVTAENGGLRVFFEKPERAPAKGQSAVFYQGDIVLGGGFIE